MDYSQFLVMKQEICLLVLFLLVFLGDTFLPKKAQSAIGTITCVLFGVFTLYRLTTYYFRAKSEEGDRKSVV